MLHWRWRCLNRRSATEIFQSATVTAMLESEVGDGDASISNGYEDASMVRADFTDLLRLGFPYTKAIILPLSPIHRVDSLPAHRVRRRSIDQKPTDKISHRKVCEVDRRFVMVQLMKTTEDSPGSQLQQRGKMAPVKREMIDESTQFDDHYVPLNKRHKHQELGIGAFPVPPTQFNPLDEPSPLGLRLRKSPSLLDLIQMRLAEGSAFSKIGSADTKKGNKTIAATSTTDKLKASNFPASHLKIGTWEYKSRYEGDLVAKCYFAKHKLVWEVLDGGLKNKIEIQWSDIMALKATYPDDGPGTLDVVLTRQPLFFRETNPQPRKHTLWQATADFTGGEASLHRRHYLQCPQGLLGKHFEKLIQCDPRLNFLSQQAEIELESPYFEPRKSVFEELNESNEYDVSKEGRAGATIFDIHRATSPSGGQSSSRSELHDPSGRPAEFSREAPSPSSVMDMSAIEEIRRAGTEGLTTDLSRWDQIKVPGINPSMSMSDLVNHIENRITEQRTTGNHPLSREEQQSLEILEDLSQCLFNDSQHGSTDEKSLMSKVNSLCCLLQKDPTTFQDLEPARPDSGPAGEGGSVAERKGECDDDCKKGSGMSRKDSVGELLLNLPRIASLPQFFYNF
ncbi:hypothetical protein SSX86_000358 [Deinandra increscens subsp. villosa]|uniref:TRF2/HOY1 PH-like domain-containing protein n=1 Tax=Deinandra increscens subsp. villosa TaxID=3103831 RepID=A0AAP0DWC3_9ASTR